MVINVCATGATDFNNLWIIGKISGALFTITFIVEFIVEIISLRKFK